MIVGTAITENYLALAIPYLRSLARLSCRKFCVTVGWHWRGNEFPDVEFVHLPMEKVTDNDSAFVCLQSGDFLDAVDDRGETIILTDADAQFQRDFHPEESDRFDSYDAKTVGIGYNCGHADTLADEYFRLRPKTPIDAFPFDLSGLMYNTGFMVGRRKAWEAIQPAYREIWQQCSANFEVPQKRQFILCLAMRQAGIRIDRLDYSIHSHGHNSGWTHHITPQHSFRDGVLRHDGQTVLFSHRVNS